MRPNALLKLRLVGKEGKKGNIGMLTFPPQNKWGGITGKIGKKGKDTERAPVLF